MHVRIVRLFFLVLLVVASPAVLQAFASTGDFGIFEEQGDVGTVLHPGSARYDATRKTYAINGSGENMWFGKDDFHFLWKKVSGNIALTADVSFVGTTGDKHRKAVLIFRQSLDAGSPSVDIARHGDGLTSLQYRDMPGVDTHEVESNISAPARVRIEKRGDFIYVYVYVSDPAGNLRPAGASTKLKLTGEFYVG